MGTGVVRDYDLPVPIYEFDCQMCGARFESLVAAGTETATCAVCGTQDAHRVFSAPAPTPRLVMTGRQDRQMQVKRGVDRATAKERFKERRQKQRNQHSRQIRKLKGEES